MSRNNAVLVFVLLFAMVLVGCGMQNKPASSQDSKYPVKPITVIVPFSAGGMTDIVTRAMEKSAVKYLGQPFIIVNKPGGAGTIGWNELVKVKPDGYTIGIATLGTVLQPIYGQSKYNYPTALEPIAQIANPPLVMSVSANSPYKTLDELITYAKQHPGAIKYGHNGLGSSPQVLVEMFARAADIKMEQVPFQGSSEGIPALLGGHIDVIISGIPEIKEHVKNNKLKVVAITGNHRINDPLLSDVPTFKEQGLNVTVNNWHCLAVPKEMPQSVKNILIAGVRNIINDPDFKSQMQELGIEAEYLGPDDCIKLWVADSEMLTKAVHDTGIFELIANQKK